MGIPLFINSRGVASIIKQHDSFLDGLLWEISLINEKALDRYEGVASNFYYKTTKTIENFQTQDTSSALVYIASDSSLGQPRHGYLEKIIQAARSFEFDSEYLTELEEWAG